MLRFAVGSLFISMNWTSVAFAADPVVRIDGSSTVFPISQAVAEEFQNSKKGAVKVTVGISGTGGGFKKFCRGETDVQDASRPISKEEMTECKNAGIQYFELPIAFDAMVVAVNPKNTTLKEISVADLKTIWDPAAQGKVMTWKQVNKAWPNEPLRLFGAGSDSGTFDYFTEAIVGKAKASRGDYTASEDDNTLVQGISSDKNALGYLPFAYYIANKDKLKALGITSDHSKGKGVFPSAETVEDGTYYPLSRPLFIYVSSKAIERPEVKEFTSYYLKNAAELAASVKYVPLPDEAYSTAQEHVNKKRLGTAFNGQPQIGIKIQELLKREAVL